MIDSKSFTRCKLVNAYGNAFSAIVFFAYQSARCPPTQAERVSRQYYVLLVAVFTGFLKALPSKISPKIATEPAFNVDTDFIFKYLFRLRPIKPSILAMTSLGAAAASTVAPMAAAVLSSAAVKLPVAVSHSSRETTIEADEAPLAFAARNLKTPVLNPFVSTTLPSIVDPLSLCGSIEAPQYILSYSEIMVICFLLCPVGHPIIDFLIARTRYS